MLTIKRKVKFTNLENGVIHVSGVEFQLSKENCPAIRDCQDEIRRDDVYHILAGFCFNGEGRLADESVFAEAVVHIDKNYSTSVGQMGFQVQVVVPFDKDYPSGNGAFVVADGCYMLQQKEPDTSILVEKLPIDAGVFYNSTGRTKINLIGLINEITT